jgi:hypothetical protein
MVSSVALVGSLRHAATGELPSVRSTAAWPVAKLYGSERIPQRNPPAKLRSSSTYSVGAV